MYVLMHCSFGSTNSGLMLPSDEVSSMTVNRWIGNRVDLCLSPSYPAKMLLVTLASLSLTAIAWCSSQIMIIQNDSADSDTSLGPIYSPPSTWTQSAFLPRNGDTNLANLTGPANVTTTVRSRSPAGASMSLIFQGVYYSATLHFTFLDNGFQVPRYRSSSCSQADQRLSTSY